MKSEENKRNEKEIKILEKELERLRKKPENKNWLLELRNLEKRQKLGSIIKELRMASSLT